ncbi:MAG: hypothetical protein UU88_C0005G0012 [Parcubacteria group bacterium GW2011_GWC1_42_11]|uniref:Uncharacterized protein n=1 Tax=Candidatus Nomurabacteria bacterium GW2011_GWC2_42_20 TaxID=1618756 RepID=A0A0G0ZEF8_9BACT|nr:MAG: hypothetical protein UU88_C0005G0012 [Parcubacteria group bacterium GW2011_GWC1_42_11]KKS47100.1 MAG: hypothetical protein UV12_C0011G0010 [Candidatus Nomurabacteria bacterium GW2011_GWC2_42_20]KKS58896.1 MAG: hypothetical protein UV24_C0013G0014 [Candidatus Nomurabacteria bacterium GW2011_GWA2_42_41]KKT09186.1 MAG: hypothetical protein UV86_C0012G0001 [Candidatus Nomurabacteria bacterium GW2011_GWB1_43_20]
MTVIIALFYLSLATIVGMVLWKLVSLRNLKLSLVEGVEKELHGKFYEKIHSMWHVFRVKVLVRVRMLMLSIFYIAAHEVLHFTELIGKKLKERHGKWFDMVKGKGVIKKKGSVSFFLKDVAEYKKSIQVK